MYIYTLSSTSRSNAHWRFHPTVTEWGEELWGATQQALHSACSHGYPCLYRNPRRFPHHCEFLTLNIVGLHKKYTRDWSVA